MAMMRRRFRCCGRPSSGLALEESSLGIRRARISRLALCFSPASTPSDHGAGGGAGGRLARYANAVYVAYDHQDPPGHVCRPSRHLHHLRSRWRSRA